MAVNRTRPGETREMRLLSKVIKMSKGPETSLPQFIARRRRPGKNWRTWPELAFEIAGVSDEVIADQSLRQWAKRYGIPEDTVADGSKGTSLEAYDRAMKDAGITIS